MPESPKCQSSNIIKSGRQRYKCKSCGFQFTRTDSRGRPASEKAMAIILYTKVSTPAVLRWVRTFAEKVYEKPEPREAFVVELDEMWHYLRSKKIVDMESLLSRYRSTH